MSKDGRKNFSMRATPWLMAGAILTWGACRGSSPSAPQDASSDGGALPDAEHFAVLLGLDDENTARDAPHCAAALEDLRAHRARLLDGSDWEICLATEAGKRLETASGGYRSDGCVDLSGNATDDMSQLCQQRREGVCEAWKGMSETAEWKTTRDSERMRALLVSWLDAKALGCVGGQRG